MTDNYDIIKDFLSNLLVESDKGNWSGIVLIFVRYRLEIIRKDKIAKITSIIGKMFICACSFFVSLK